MTGINDEGEDFDEGNGHNSIGFSFDEKQYGTPPVRSNQT